MTLEAMRPLPPVAPAPAVPARQLDFKIQVVNAINLQEATLRKVVTPELVVDQDTKTIQIVSRGLSLTEEKRQFGDRAAMIEVAARYRRGEGAIRQSYRYLVFENPEERDGLGNLYAIRLPMGSWTPNDPDICLEWLGRGGFQQGDFVLLPRKVLPVGSMEVEQPQTRGFWQMAAENFRKLLTETVGECQPEMDEWTRLIGRHDPKDARLYRKDDRLFLVAEADTVVEHPEHAPLALPQGVYEVVEDRATSYWRKAID
ncbi:MAG: hypothetical protein ACK46X_05925 [Candidatus Sericytochromatia bacterium]